MFLIMLLVDLLALSVMENTLELIICRHGEAEQNIGGWYSSNPRHPSYIEAHLTTRGIKQVRQLGSDLKSTGLTADNICQVFASPLPRTCESARNVMDVLAIPEQKLIIEPKLIESQMGDRESQKITQYNDKDFWFPESPESFNGESREAIKARMSEAFKAIHQKCHNHQGRYVLLFSHGAPVYLLLEKLTGTGERLPPGGCKRLTVTPAML
ncbi:histidine phosphatase family protein [Endozoicomonas euniceicola]|uniref:Histidine phosphatase family protein n=1 Tax=Endozoicomonas euniceicola TaxID=1234143 RepID=A0ABY6GX93_9GAMM|nr:histidine phosphatase family protein [Endozoicomonas euniceicola]UYM17397.1 histidine phosphatase family protein [Endozoicomonas euniceicola]